MEPVGSVGNLGNLAMVASIGVCLLALAVILLAKPLQMLFRFAISALLGGVILFLGNSLGVAVGVNALTLFTAGILGLPGVAGLFLLSLLL